MIKGIMGQPWSEPSVCRINEQHHSFSLAYLILNKLAVELFLARNNGLEKPFNVNWRTQFGVQMRKLGLDLVQKVQLSFSAV